MNTLVIQNSIIILSKVVAAEIDVDNFELTITMDGDIEFIFEYESLSQTQETLMRLNNAISNL